jgi:hypothetical protein
MEVTYEYRDPKTKYFNTAHMTYLQLTHGKTLTNKAISYDAIFYKTTCKKELGCPQNKEKEENLGPAMGHNNPNTECKIIIFLCLQQLNIILVHFKCENLKI